MPFETGEALKKHFLLNPEIVFLNHGSFGACPEPVFQAYQEWQRELEWQPVEFLGRRHDTLMNEARAALADYVGSDLDDLVFVPNATAGVNVVARGLATLLGPDDEILTTDHEYGACSNAWTYVCDQTGARYIQQPIPLPVTTSEAFVEQLWAGVTPKTRVIYLSHITSPTALIFPIEAVIRRAREAGIITVVDGAHAPGQIPLDMRAIDADFYTGNCHKWMCTPKGSAFLYTRREYHHLLMPLIISWGCTPGSTYVQRLQAQGTRDLAPYLAVPAAIKFFEEYRWDDVRAYCHGLILEARARLNELTGLAPIAPDPDLWHSQLVMLRLPPCDLNALKTSLYDDYHIEIPMIDWNGNQGLRVSIQGYNTRADVDTLVKALAQLL